MFQLLTNYIFNNNKLVSDITINTHIYEAFALTKIVQTVLNKTNKTLEINIELPISNNVILQHFEARINNRVYKSKIMDIEKAKEKYSDSISSGNTGLMGTYSQNPDDEVKNYVIQIGNLVANEELQIETSLIQQIDSEDLSYKYRFLKFESAKSYL